jgi:hypothetical protein
MSVNRLQISFFKGNVLISMTRHLEVHELLEQYMEASGSSEQWVTVRELRSHFDLDDSAGPAISGFLQRINYGHFFSLDIRLPE